MRILIYGAGVIGSLYAALFAEAGYDTSIYARGKRFEVLRNNGFENSESRKGASGRAIPRSSMYFFAACSS